MAANSCIHISRLGAIACKTLPGHLELNKVRKYVVGTARASRRFENRGAPHGALAELRQPIWASTVQPYGGVEHQSSAKTTDAGKRRRHADPKELVGSELSHITENISRLLESGDPMLGSVSKYYLTSGGKKTLPLLVFLIAQATSIATKCSGKPAVLEGTGIDQADYSFIDRALSSKTQGRTGLQRADWPIESGATDSGNLNPYLPYVKDGLTILPTHRRLAEVAEMIHIASLLHDDVVDNAEARRGLPAAQRRFGNKMVIFAGDFIVFRLYTALVRLRDPDVIEIMTSLLSDLIEGEFKQLRNIEGEGVSMSQPDERVFDFYLEKSYLKTGSQLDKCCRSSAILSSAADEVVEAAGIYGRNLGVAYQIIDDLLDFTVSEKELGKPVGADLGLGLATAPVLYAWQEYPELGPLIARRFSVEGDVSRAWDLVHASKGLEKTKRLASLFVERASQALLFFPPSPARDALEHLTSALLERTK
ncbi:coq1 putative hexaprenyl diphosphate synthase [Dipsacomyces acuminosporus]|nr:coq1 putative hexaprenyl diphosphate synthase [Dipsacomyces acuminosporus]